jgi:hypothetical protein
MVYFFVFAHREYFHNKLYIFNENSEKKISYTNTSHIEMEDFYKIMNANIIIMCINFLIFIFVYINYFKTFSNEFAIIQRNLALVNNNLIIY